MEFPRTPRTTVPSNSPPTLLPALTFIIPRKRQRGGNPSHIHVIIPSYTKGGRMTITLFYLRWRVSTRLEHDFRDIAKHVCFGMAVHDRHLPLLLCRKGSTVTLFNMQKYGLVFFS